jgi:biopolymer transport protein ExbB
VGAIFSRVFNVDNFAFVLLVLLAFIELLYIVERCLFLHGNRVEPQQFIGGIRTLLDGGRTKDAIKVCDEAPGIVPLIVKEAIRCKRLSCDEMRNAFSNVVSIQIPLLERRLGLIKLIAKIAPLVSFIAVLQFLRKSLKGIEYAASYFSASDVLNFMLSASSIVIFGIIINIVGVIASHFLYGRVKYLVHDMEVAANEMFACFTSERAKK